jgi:hypothetical protein
LEKLQLPFAALLFGVVLTKLANRVPAEGAMGTWFSRREQKVLACLQNEIVVVEGDVAVSTVCLLRLLRDG